MHVDLQQQRTVHSEGQNVAPLNACLASLDAVLQVKSKVLGSLGRRQLFEQFFCTVQGQLGVNGVVLRDGLQRTQGNTGYLADKDQFVGLQSDRN